MKRMIIAVVLLLLLVRVGYGRVTEWTGVRPAASWPTSWRTAGFAPRIGSAFLAILAGVAGNVVGMYAGIYLGNVIPAGNGEESVAGPLLGGLVGSTCGSALGVYLAGSSSGRRGSFGPALLGSCLGEAAAFALVAALHGEDTSSLLPFLLLPPIGAALVHTSSLASGSIRAGGGILNLADGRMGLGVPEVRVRPLIVPGLNAKPGMQFNVRLMSVEL